MTRTVHRPRSALEAWVGRFAPDATNLPGYLEILQAAELAHTVKGDEGLDALEEIITNPHPEASGPFDPEIRSTLVNLVDQAKDAMADAGVDLEAEN